MFRAELGSGESALEARAPSQMRQASHRASHRAFLPSLGAILWPSGTYWEMDSWDPLLRPTHPRSHQPVVG